MELQRILRLHLSPNTLPGGPGDKLGGPENYKLVFLQELVGRNNLLKLLSPHIFDRFYLFRFSIILLGFVKKKEHYLLIKLMISILYLKTVEILLSER